MGCNCNKDLPNHKPVTENKVVETVRWAATIITAWGNYITNNQAANIKASQRAEICINCVYRVKNSLLSPIRDEIKSIEGYECNKCGCPLSAKLRSNGNCPLNSW